MKWIIAWAGLPRRQSLQLYCALAALIFCGGIMAQEGDGGTAAKKPAPSATPAAAPALQLSLELYDGSHIIGAPVVDRFKITIPLTNVDVPLSRMHTLQFSGTDNSVQMDLENGEHLVGLLDASEITLKTNFGQVTVPMALVGRIEVDDFDGGAFVNSLGMRFVPVPGTKVLFSIWDTRVQDYSAYAQANTGVDTGWKNAGFEQAWNEPVVNVVWEEAKAFCAWLTQKERKEGKIRKDQEYRLPTDEEWSVAVGAGKYPWGDDWPPPKGAGNYAPGLDVDDFGRTSPVGSFAPNQFGLYDMGGNVWQWCEDWYRAGMNSQATLDAVSGLGEDGGGKKYHVLRGGSWGHGEIEHLLSSYRDRGNSDDRPGDRGFRCVLAPVAPSQ